MFSIFVAINVISSYECQMFTEFIVDKRKWKMKNWGRIHQQGRWGRWSERRSFKAKKYEYTIDTIFAICSTGGCDFAHLVSYSSYE